jgi:hypothetical protein
MIEMDVGDSELRDVIEVDARVGNGSLEHREGGARSRLDQRVTAGAREEIGGDDTGHPLEIEIEEPEVRL